MNRQTSYQRRLKEIKNLKKDLEEMKGDIYALVNDPDSERSLRVNISCKLHKNIHDTFWATNKDEGGIKSGGIFKFEEPKRKKHLFIERWINKLIKGVCKKLKEI